MRKSFFRLLTVLLLVFATVIALGSCGKQNDAAETAGTGEVTVSNNIVTLSPDAALSYADYKIVRADKTTKGVKEAATLLRDKVKELTGVGSRCIPFEQENISDKCVCCGKPAKCMVYWGKAY